MKHVASEQVKAIIEAEQFEKRLAMANRIKHDNRIADKEKYFYIAAGPLQEETPCARL